jgi:hypothetical protein
VTKLNFELFLFDASPFDDFENMMSLLLYVVLCSMVDVSTFQLNLLSPSSPILMMKVAG